MQLAKIWFSIIRHFFHMYELYLILSTGSHNLKVAQIKTAARLVSTGMWYGLADELVTIDAGSNLGASLVGTDL
jgi:hypothetical protein